MTMNFFCLYFSPPATIMAPAITTTVDCALLHAYTMHVSHHHLKPPASVLSIYYYYTHQLARHNRIFRLIPESIIDTRLSLVVVTNASIIITSVHQIKGGYV